MLSLLNTTFTNAVRKGFSLVSSLLNKLKQRVAADGGTFENEACTKAILNDLNNKELLSKATLLTTATAYNFRKIYSIKPSGLGDGDFEFNRGSLGTRVNSAGYIDSTLANAQPRIDYLNGCGSILLEPARTNVQTRSEEFDNSVWSKNRSSITPNQITSPDGSSLADRIECGINGNLTPIFDYINITNGEYYTFSVFAKKGEIDKFIISGQENLLTNVSFNLTTGTIISTSGSGYVDSTIEEFSNGWYRCSVTALANGTRLGRFILYAGISGNEPNLGDGIYYFGAQQEQKSFATSYISTQGATSTRIAETCTNSGSAQDFNDSEGVLMAEISALDNSEVAVRTISIINSCSEALSHSK